MEGGCNNISEIKKRKSNNICSVPQCKSYYTGGVSLHRFPRDPKIKKEWVIKLKIGKPVTPHMVVCNKHFQKDDYYMTDYPGLVHMRPRLKPAAVPTQNLPVTKYETSKAMQQKRAAIQERATRYYKRQKKHEAAFGGTTGEITEESGHFDVELDAATTLLQLGNIAKFEKCYEDKGVQVDMYNEPIFYKEEAVQVNTLEEQRAANVADLLDTSYKLKLFTGIINVNILSIIVTTIMKLKGNQREDRRGLSVKEKVVLCMMRLKLDLSLNCLAVLFHISASTAQKYFHEICPLLSCALSPLIRFPSQCEIRQNLPECFWQFKNTRIVLDCTEVSIMRSKCLKCRIRSYSHYKGQHTLKFLVGISPSGMIIYLSKAYGGRVSDKAIFNRENLIHKLDPGDAVMVDKGFLIEEECYLNGIKLIRPPFLGRNKPQFSKFDAERTACIARARVHVERSIQRIKLFKILQSKLSLTTLPLIDNILQIICALHNLSEPILDSKHFVKNRVAMQETVNSSDRM